MQNCKRLVMNFPPTTEMEESEDIESVIYTFGKIDLNFTIDIEKLLNDLEYNVKPCKKKGEILYSSVQIRLRSPRVTAEIYRSGKVSMTGPVDDVTLKQGAKKIGRIVHEILE